MKNKSLYIIGIFFIIILVIILIPKGGKTSIIDEQSIQLSTTTVNINVGQSFQITAYVLPENATYKNLIWTSLNSNIATVNNGLITGINPGNCMIHVKTENKKIFKIVSVTVNSNIINMERIIVNNKNIEMFIGDTTKIDFIIEPNNTTDKTLAFNIDDKNIISINENHEVTGLREGNTFITIVSNNGIREKINVTVKKKIIEVSSVSLNKYQVTMNVGKIEKLSAKVLPSDATNPSITWKSSNEKIAKVNSNGEVTGISSGNAVITALANNGKYASCTVTVSEPFEPPIINNSNISKYNNVVSCHSESLKYNIINYNGNDLVFIWAKNPAKQLSSALAVGNGSGNAAAEVILQNEINRYGYQNKCMVAANASFFNMSTGSILGGIIINKGNIIRNNGYASVVGINNKGYLNQYINKPISDLQNDGVVTTFVHSFGVLPQDVSSSDRTNRTIICQVNKNNFVLVSGSGDPAKLVYDVTTFTNIRACFNLDGGGSRKLYYKTQISPIIKRFGGSRAIPDMIYFVEE